MSGTKIKTLAQIKNISAKLKKAGKKLVFTNGCFDLLHYGHVQYLEKAKSLGDMLVVAINSDASAKRLKGKRRPIVNQSDRAKVISGLESVDYVVIFSQDTPLKTIQVIKPDILVKGADWKHKGIIGADFIGKYGGKTKTIQFAQGRSTSNLIQKIVHTYAK